MISESSKILFYGADNDPEFWEVAALFKECEVPFQKIESSNEKSVEFLEKLSEQPKIIILSTKVIEEDPNKQIEVIKVISNAEVILVGNISKEKAIEAFSAKIICHLILPDEKNIVLAAAEAALKNKEEKFSG